MTEKTDTLIEARAAISDIVDLTPLAPEWHDLAAGVRQLAPPRPKQQRGIPVALATALLLIVAIGSVALLRASGDADVATTISTTVTTAEPQITTPTVPVERVDLGDQIGFVSASSPVGVSNLVDGSAATAWTDAGLRGVGAELQFVFSEPAYVDTVVISNLDDVPPTRTNYAIRDIRIELQTDGGQITVEASLPDNAGPHIIPLGESHRGLLVLRVLSVWPEEDAAYQPASDNLAVAEVDFYGTMTPAAITTPPDFMSIVIADGVVKVEGEQVDPAFTAMAVDAIENRCESSPNLQLATPGSETTSLPPYATATRIIESLSCGVTAMSFAIQPDGVANGGFAVANADDADRLHELIDHLVDLGGEVLLEVAEDRPFIDNDADG